MSLDRSVKDPKLEELTEAAVRLGFSPEPVRAKFPSRMMQSSGYVSVGKKGDLNKEQLINQLSKTLATVRGEKGADATAVQHKDRPKGPQKKR